MMNSISIIIPNLNGEEFLPACLKSLKTAIDQAKIKVEIILVDNASSDTSPEIFTSFCQKNKIKYQLLSLNKNYGFAGAVNRGVEASKFDWVLVCNNDLKIDNKWLFFINKALNNQNSKILNSKIAAISGTVLNYDGSRFESQGLKFHYSGKCDNISNGQPYSTTSLKNYSTTPLSLSTIKKSLPKSAALMKIFLPTKRMLTYHSGFIISATPRFMCPRLFLITWEELPAPAWETFATAWMLKIGFTLF